MLNKDEYNQEEYNDYYRQEVEGAEVEETQNEGGIISKIIILLVLLALAIAGYFGYKAMNTSSVDDIDTSLQVSMESSLPQSMQEEPEPIVNIETKEEELEKVIQTEPTKSVQLEPIKTTQVKPDTNIEPPVISKIETEEKMSTEEVATLVAAVMQKMNQQKKINTSSTPEAVQDDVALINELSSSDIDSISADLIKELEGLDVSEHTEVKHDNKQVDVYNKVNVQNVSGADTLSQLSSQINSVMAEEIDSNTVATYTNSLKSEVDVRTNEMRIIVVRQGDTLGKIAKRAYGNVMEYQKIYSANPELTRPDRIYIGQKVRIPN